MSWVVLALLSGCQSSIGGNDPATLDMPPGKADDVTDPTPRTDPDTCADAACDPEQAPDPLPASPGVEREPNDDPELATVAGVPVLVVQGELTEGDHDWYLIRIVQRGGYVFETSTGDVTDDQATDTMVRVHSQEDPDEELGFDDDSGEGLGSRLGVVLSPGSYLVEVTGFGGRTTGPYALEVDGPQELEEPETNALPAALLPPAELDESESNDSIDDADSMGDAPDSIGAELEAAGHDYFAFAAAAAGTVTIETGPRLEGGAIVDTVIELYTPDGTLLGSDDDGADAPLFSRLTIDLPAPGIYVIGVRGYRDTSTGSYRTFFVP